MALVCSKVVVRSLFLILLAINIVLDDILPPTEARTLIEIGVLQSGRKMAEFVDGQMTLEAMKVGGSSPVIGHAKESNNYLFDAKKYEVPSPGIGHTKESNNYLFDVKKDEVPSPEIGH